MPTDAAPLFDESRLTRLFSISGIGAEAEAERRAADALLSALTIVRPFSEALLSPMGASRSSRATVESYSEVAFDTGEGDQARPDGVVVVRSGRNRFMAMVEFKIGDSALDAEQLTKYLRVARSEGFDSLITVSNDPAPFDGSHPVQGVRVPAKVALHHLSWQRILAEAIRETVRSEVTDPEQARVMAELIRYLQHPKSGVKSFSDMGPHWVEVRDAARDSLLARSTPAVADVCRRWDQLVHAISMELGAKLGLNVTEVVTRAHRQNPQLRSREIERRLCEEGTLKGRIRVPGAVSDMQIEASVRASRIAMSAEIAAPDSKGARGRVGWVVRKLRHASGEVVLKAFVRGSSNPEIATVAEARENPVRLLRSPKQPPARFLIEQRSEMGYARRTARRLSFSDSVIDAVERFYGDVLQGIRPDPPAAPPRLPRSNSEVESTPTDAGDSGT